MASCAKCGYRLAYRACYSCKAKQIEYLYCPGCGSRLSSNPRFSSVPYPCPYPLPQQQAAWGSYAAYPAPAYTGPYPLPSFDQSTVQAQPNGGGAASAPVSNSGPSGGVQPQHNSTGNIAPSPQDKAPTSGTKQQQQQDAPGFACIQQDGTLFLHQNGTRYIQQQLEDTNFAEAGNGHIQVTTTKYKGKLLASHNGKVYVFEPEQQ